MTHNVEILERFKRIHSQERLAHAYLFCGPQHVSKTQTALAVAKLLNCEQSNDDIFFCDTCASCHKINAGNHPDVGVISVGVGETIKIDEIRAFIKRVGLRPFEARWKVFVLRNAQRLTNEAANALLKTLEEPGKETLLILTSSAVDLCLDTIKSRCQVVHFFPRPFLELASELQKDLEIDPNIAQSLSFFSQGSYLRAKAYFDSKFIVKKNRIIDEMVLKKNSDEFLRKTLSDKEETQTLLQVLLVFFRDLLILKSGVNQQCLANPDRLRELNALAREFSFDQINRIIDEIIKSIKLFKESLNVKMSLGLIKELVWVK